MSDTQSETLDTLAKNKDAWAVETVLYYLHRLGSYVNCSAPTVTRAHRMLGIFASVALSRLECLLGDFHASLAALGHACYTSSTGEVCMMEEINAVFAAKLSLAYHAGVSYLMLRRYKDAIHVLGDMCVQMNRGFTVR